MRLALALALAVAPSAAFGFAHTGTTSWTRPIGLSVSLETAIGVGTFVSSEYADDPYYGSSLSLDPSYALDEELTLSLHLGFAYEWTYLVTPCRAATGPRPAGAPAQDCSDTGDPNGRRFDLDDVSLSLSHAGLELPLELTLDGRASVALPTSRGSRAATNVLTAGLGVGLRRSFELFTPSIGLSFSKYFPIDDAPLAEMGDTDVPIGRCRDPLKTSCLLLSGFVPSWRLGVELGVGFELGNGFDASISFGYAYTAKFGRAPDAASSPRLDADGQRIVTGVGASDTTSGGLELGFTPEATGEAWRFALGVSSSQPARTEDGRALRFPFFDFISPANNYSAWYLSVSWTP